MSFMFRVDASLEIGIGHVMRCLTLADALKAKGVECVFICREHSGNSIEKIRDKDYPVHVLPVCEQESGHGDLFHASWLGATQEQDAVACAAILAQNPVDWLIVDHYALDKQWESALRPHYRKIMVIDDLADRQHDCDLLLDQNLVANREHRYDGLLPESCACLLGPEYALLQAQYAEWHKRVPPRSGVIRRILVYFGGADNVNLTGKSIAAFLALNRADIALDVVTHPASRHMENIRQQTAGHSQITLYESLPSLARLMVKADLAIGAGGATSWERCCLGLPSLVITLAENQKPIAVELERQGLIRWLGHSDEINEAILTQALKEIVENKLSPEWSEKCHQLIDGKGILRIMEKLHEYTQSEILVKDKNEYAYV
jgi:UDP-2,4-diacetamido-2,4,6-trideoxy-beta-L-altropyranose hydrolase